MVRFSTVVFASLVFGTFGVSNLVAQSWPPSADSARQTIVEWLQNNNKFGPDSGFVNDMRQVAEEEIEKEMNVNFFFGADLMESGVFKSLSLFNHRVMVFDMTPEQAAAMELGSSSVTTSSSGSHGSPAEQQSFELSQLVVNSADAVGKNAKISGQVFCKALGDTGSQEYALRISYRAAQGVSQFHYLDTAPSSDGETISFEFEAVNDEDAETVFTGPVAMLFDIVTVDQSGGDVKITYHSNLLGQMVTVTD